eukprot:2354233-Rhodomonas_salina.2
MFGTGVAYGAVGLCACYAMSGTDLAFVPGNGTVPHSIHSCLVQCAISLRACCAMPGTGMARGTPHLLCGARYWANVWCYTRASTGVAMVLCICCAMRGTDVACGTTRAEIQAGDTESARTLQEIKQVSSYGLATPCPEPA